MSPNAGVRDALPERLADALVHAAPEVLANAHVLEVLLKCLLVAHLTKTSANPAERCATRRAHVGLQICPSRPFSSSRQPLPRT